MNQPTRSLDGARRSEGTELDPLKLVMVADVAESDVAVFQAYESQVLPLLARHGGRLERRLRSADGTFEAQLISFTTDTGYQSFLADPGRVDARQALQGGEIAQRVTVVHEVPAPVGADTQADMNQ